MEGEEDGGMGEVNGRDDLSFCREKVSAEEGGSVNDLLEMFQISTFGGSAFLPLPFIPSCISFKNASSACLSYDVLPGP